MADFWSALSRIWNISGRPASLWCFLRNRLHKPWNVPTHIPLVLMGSWEEILTSISFAALLVKVTARMPPGLVVWLCINHATLEVSTFVFPLPAPAKINADSSDVVTASICFSFRSARLEFWLIDWFIKAYATGNNF